MTTASVFSARTATANRLSPNCSPAAFSRLDVGFFAQHQIDDLDPAGTPYSHVAERMRGAPVAKIRARAAGLGFPGAKADTAVSLLSGGEKARLLMGLATFDGPQLIILDEPTNHLDIDSRAELIEAINDYEGACILVSHDRRLLEACVDRLWLVADGGVKPFEGDLDDYRRLVLAKSAPDSGEKRGEEPREERREVARARRDLAPLRKDIAAAEEKIRRFADLMARVDAALARPEAFGGDGAKAMELSRQRGELEKALIAAEELWLTLSSEAEATSGVGG
jgi:ATP-binding cassette subfamily F protein 3